MTTVVLDEKELTLQEFDKKLQTLTKETPVPDPTGFRFHNPPDEKISRLIQLQEAVHRATKQKH